MELSRNAAGTGSSPEKTAAGRKAEFASAPDLTDAAYHYRGRNTIGPFFQLHRGDHHTLNLLPIP
jgi:hypothetical protein